MTSARNAANRGKTRAHHDVPVCRSSTFLLPASRRTLVWVEYLPRIVDDRLSRLLRAQPAARLDGPRGCGKTTTALRHAGSATHLDSSAAMRELAQLDPDRILAGTAPRLVDEWRLAPTLWPHLAGRLEDRPLPGRYLLASSATPLSYRLRTPGADQLPVLQMRTLALAEHPDAQPQVSLAGLAHGDRVTNIRSRLGYRDLAGVAVRGGWPALTDASPEQAAAFNTAYLDDLARVDVAAAVPTRHQPERVRQLLDTIARQTGRPVSLAGLGNHTAGRLGRDTVRAYLDALTRVHAIEYQPAWQPPLRTRTRLRHQPRLHLADPALACAALGLGADEVADQPDQYNAIFTALAIHDLRVYLEGTGARLWHYRDETGLAIDAIVEYPDRSWAALQTCLGEHRLLDAEIQLHTLIDDRLDLNQTGRPRYLAILTATTHGHTTRSDTRIIPLPTLTA